MRKFSIQTNLASLLDGEHRLDAAFYSTDASRARAALAAFEKCGGQVKTIGDLSRGTFNPPPIKRVFTDDERLGTPYMLPQEMYDFYWHPRKYVLSDKMSNIEDWYLQNGWVVLSQSGTVGKPYFATKSDENVVLSQNAIRVPPREKKDGGYLYAYFSTWIGQALLKKDRFGITVKHIRPHQVDSVPIPVLDKKKRERIDDLVATAFNYRAKAIELLNRAKAEIYDELGAPHNIDTAAGTEEDEET